MSRRAPNPAAERAAQNQQTIKSLLKLESNKVCSDCKRNKHPRWASWNLGVFICIRCSGIHRGMGVHISRVKSVDLDTWTDEQLQSVLNWGNARANKYWESKLAPGHVPSEAKIENFIRTKYELKRWAMDGPIPDPSTLDADADDDIPLSIVKEKQTIDRKESVRKASVGKTSRPPAAAIDLIGGGDTFTSSTPPPRASTISPNAARVPPKAEPAPPKATPAPSNASLLGLDFLGSAPAAPARPSSTTGSATGAAQSRPDLKQSILSLYATAPRQQQQQPQQQQNMGGFGGMQSPGLSQGANAGFTDAFSNLSFSQTPAPAQSKPVDAFAGLGGFSSGSNSARSTPAPAAASSSAFGGLGGGSFFDAKSSFSAAPAPPPKPAASSAFGGLGGFDAFSSTPSPPAASKPAAASSNAFGDLFDFGAPAPAATPAAPAPQPAVSSPPPGMNSVFNLSAPAAQPAKSASPAAPAATSSMAAVSANWGNSDVWGNNDGWGAPAAAAPAAAPAATASSGGWGSSATATGTGSFASQSIVPGAGGGFAPAPKVAADEEFGGWASSTPAAASNTAAKPAGFGGASEDLFSNVWN